MSEELPTREEMLASYMQTAQQALATMNEAVLRVAALTAVDGVARKGITRSATQINIKLDEALHWFGQLAGETEQIIAIQEGKETNEDVSDQQSPD